MSGNRLYNVGVFFSTFAVIVVIAALGYGYSQLSKVNLSLVSMVTHLQSQVTASDNEIKSLQQSLQEVQAVADKSKDLSIKQEQLLNEWQESQKGNFEKWHVAEADYLVRLANDHVVFTHNTLMALTLLQRADKVLSDLNDNALLPIRKSIANDISALLTRPQVDTTQLYLILEALNQQIDKLPLPYGPLQKFAESNSTTTDSDSGDLPWWKHGLHSTLDALKKIVIVRYNGANAPPLVLPDEREFLFQNLRAQIDIAIWGALHGDKRIYDTSLAQAMAWVRQYFLMTAPETQAMLQRLEALRNLNVAPPNANLTPTLQLFDKYLNRTA